LALQPAKLLAPPIIRHLAHPDLADCVHHVLALRNQNIDLPQLRNDLFRLVSLPCHCSPPGCQRHTSSRTTSMGVDQPHTAPPSAAVQEPTDQAEITVSAQASSPTPPLRTVPRNTPRPSSACRLAPMNPPNQTQVLSTPFAPLQHF